MVPLSSKFFAFLFWDSMNTDQTTDRDHSDLLKTVSWMSNINLCSAEPVFILFLKTL